ncbi:type II toxin-antitoxin system CcdA family antitoxin [Methylovulum psychrotolerans]|uniref:type II toxin-antitoxin system CcdA family antitoxin n=1 Tax=Methylovulum psychrotolerans TaxID=1704499 RepID=UPI001BFFB3FE|nr:type II toxin-antitoxin system CcdA family antitoxin [Methylovulum psychrotolerans]MBT9098586.1 type II toxin-antitoxin system CcdA family antitoxin [Methylovulum psychrotolerans]
MQALYETSAAKKPTNVSINTDLLKQAKALDINLSAALEQKLVELIKLKQAANWLADNQAAIASYNRHVDEHGVFSDDIRSF